MVSSFKIPAWLEPGLYGIGIGAIAWWIVLSLVFGWMSAGTAAKTSAEKVQVAVVAYATPACVARFEKQPDAAAAWNTLNKTDTWKRNEMITNAGWVAEPGQKLDPDIVNAIAESCTTKILALASLGGKKLNAK